MTTATDAYAAIAQRLLDTVTNGAAAICGYVPEVRWPKRTYSNPPDASKLWVRFSTTAHGEIRRTLSKPSRITREGALYAQIFAPIDQPNAAALCEQLAYLIEAAYANGEYDGVWYSGAFSKEMPRETAWYCQRVSATYRYDDFQ